MAPNHASQWMGSRARRLIIFTMVASILAGLALGRPSNTKAAAVLTITSTTWNLVGLDSTDVDAGPNVFPVGARVCNTGDQPATNVVTNFVWDSDDPYVNLTGPTSLTRASLAANTCADFYYNVAISRDDNAYLAIRSYHITAAADGVTAVSTPTPREVWVDSLETNPAIIPGKVSGPPTVGVGGSYEYVVRGGPIPQLEQVVNTINFPANQFRVTSIAARYSVPAGATSKNPYVDACGWDSNPNNIGSTYLTCTGPDGVTGGQIGGSFVLTYSVDVIATGVVTLTNVIYGYNETDDAFYYQVAAAGDQLRVTAQANLTPIPNVTTTPGAPTATTGPGTPTATGSQLPVLTLNNSVTPTQARYNQTFVFTIRITNSGPTAAMNLTFTDSFSAYLDVSTYTASKGTVNANQSTRTVTAALGNLNPNETVVVTIGMKVNQTAKSNIPLTNYATVTYSTGSATLTATSNTVNFRVQGANTLPGTGGMELEQQQGETSLFLPALLSSLLLGFLGLFALAYSLRARGSQPAWAGWFARVGLMLLGAGLVFGLGAWALQRPGPQPAPLVMRPGAAPAAQEQAQPTEKIRKPRRPRGEPTAPLPDTATPTPPVLVSPSPEGEKADTSPIIRLIIPALSVDNGVQYVPFDGLTWDVQNLQQQIAWLGNSQSPGAGGNTLLAGHVSLRTGSDGPFRHLDSLSPGDRLTVYTAENVYSYRVREQRVVEDMDFSVMNAPVENQLTLITCAGWDNDLKLYLSRLVVFADLVKVEPSFDRTLSN